MPPSGSAKLCWRRHLSFEFSSIKVLLLIQYSQQTQHYSDDQNRIRAGEERQEKTFVSYSEQWYTSASRILLDCKLGRQLSWCKRWFFRAYDRISFFLATSSGCSLQPSPKMPSHLQNHPKWPYCLLWLRPLPNGLQVRQPRWYLLGTFEESRRFLFSRTEDATKKTRRAQSITRARITSNTTHARFPACCFSLIWSWLPVTSLETYWDPVKFKTW